MIAGIVLAAGGSTRMGRPKMLLPAGSGTLLSAAVAPLLEAGLDRVVVVLGDRAEEVRSGARLPTDPRLVLVICAGWAAGMAASLKRGLEACADADAVVVALGDQPGVTAERVRMVMAAYGSGRDLVVPVHRGIPAHPVLFGRSLFSELETLTGDVGAREVIRRHEGEAIRLEIEPLPDIDTEDDYRQFMESEG
jgi:molybdenum cofactor cytidylyltransferase